MAEDIRIIAEIFVVYGIMIFLFPSFMIRPLIRKESLPKQAFAVLAAGNLLIISLVFILAFLQWYTTPIFLTIYFGLIIGIRYYLDKKKIKNQWKKQKQFLFEVQQGLIGVRLIKKRILIYLQKTVKSLPFSFGGIIEFCCAAALILFHIYIFSHRALTLSSFSAPDEEVHLLWIQSLLKNQIYQSGMYPFGFHNIVSSIILVTGIPSVSVVRYFGVLQSTVLVLFEYLCLKKLLRNRFAPIFGFAIVVLSSLLNQESVSRFQYPVPQEFGIVFLFVMFVFLIDFIKEKKRIDGIFFGIGFSLTLHAHYYDTILALLLCFCVGLAYLVPIFKEKLFPKLLLYGIIATGIGVWPIITGFCMGYPFEQSMAWAVSVIKNEDNLKQEKIEKEEEKKTETRKEKIEKTLLEHVFTRKEGIFFIILMFGIGVFLYGVTLILKKSLWKEGIFPLYLFFTIIVILFLAKELGLPVILYSTRLTTCLHFCFFFLISIPLELIYRIFSFHIAGKMMSISLTIISIIGSCFIINKNDLWKEFPLSYYYQTQGISRAVTRIINTYPPHNWTVVSTVNEVSMIYRKGYHYEWIDIIEKLEEKKEILIPTKYVFFMIEKMPIVKYGWEFAPDAKELYSRPKIQRENKEKKLRKEKNREDYYKNQREIVMAKAYFWTKELVKHYPAETEIYYEDEEIIIYRLEQNEAYGNLAVSY